MPLDQVRYSWTVIFIGLPCRFVVQLERRKYRDNDKSRYREATADVRRRDRRLLSPTELFSKNKKSVSFVKDEVTITRQERWNDGLLYAGIMRIPTKTTSGSCSPGEKLAIG
ncbi:MAG: hypothetical protein HUJ74_01040 [Lachnospiraceae bacterium]|nr:hypothetical protein [Lachnospiraceae bacterium]